MLPQNCTKRKHEYRIHKLLSNRQWLNLYFQKYQGDRETCVWTTALCISDGIKSANQWYTGLRKGYRKINNKITGKCGIEGLKKAAKYICSFADNLKLNEELHVGWADDRRKYAYRGLLKRGFYVDEKEKFYHTRNLKYWKSNELSVSELTQKAYKRGDTL